MTWKRGQKAAAAPSCPCDAGRLDCDRFYLYGEHSPERRPSGSGHLQDDCCKRWPVAYQRERRLWPPTRRGGEQPGKYRRVWRNSCWGRHHHRRRTGHDSQRHHLDNRQEKRCRQLGATREWMGRDSNSRPPVCKTGILTRLDYPSGKTARRQLSGSILIVFGVAIGAIIIAANRMPFFQKMVGK